MISGFQLAINQRIVHMIRPRQVLLNNAKRFEYLYHQVTAHLPFGHYGRVSAAH